MRSAEHLSLLHELDTLRRELVDLAYSLDRRGNPTAADLATAVSGRLAELTLAPDRTAAPTIGRPPRFRLASRPTDLGATPVLRSAS